jgi:hypothetical protein
VSATPVSEQYDTKPMTATGKIQEHVLRAHFAATLETEQVAGR